jgi:hypothetical protein
MTHHFAAPCEAPLMVEVLPYLRASRYYSSDQRDAADNAVGTPAGVGLNQG